MVANLQDRTLLGEIFASGYWCPNRGSREARHEIDAPLSPLGFVPAVAHPLLPPAERTLRDGRKGALLRVSGHFGSKSQGSSHPEERPLGRVSKGPLRRGRRGGIGASKPQGSSHPEERPLGRVSKGPLRRGRRGGIGASKPQGSSHPEERPLGRVSKGPLRRGRRGGIGASKPQGSSHPEERPLGRVSKGPDHRGRSENTDSRRPTRARNR